MLQTHELASPYSSRAHLSPADEVAVEVSVCSPHLAAWGWDGHKQHSYLSNQCQLQLNPSGELA